MAQECAPADVEMGVYMDEKSAAFQSSRGGQLLKKIRDDRAPNLAIADPVIALTPARAGQLLERASIDAVAVAVFSPNR